MVQTLIRRLRRGKREPRQHELTFRRLRKGTKTLPEVLDFIYLVWVVNRDVCQGHMTSRGGVFVRTKGNVRFDFRFGLIILQVIHLLNSQIKFIYNVYFVSLGTNFTET